MPAANVVAAEGAGTGANVISKSARDALVTERPAKFIVIEFEVNAKLTGVKLLMGLIVTLRIAGAPENVNTNPLNVPG